MRADLTGGWVGSLQVVCCALASKSAEVKVIWCVQGRVMFLADCKCAMFLADARRVMFLADGRRCLVGRQGRFSD